MNIGIDLDGTITDFNSFILIDGIKYGNKRFKSNKIIDKNAYNIENIFSWDNDEVKEYKEYVRTVSRMKVKPRKDARKVLNFLHNRGFKIYIITSRKENDQYDVYNNTLKWLYDNKIYYDKIIIGNSNKAQECINNNIDVFIDDKVKHCNACEKIGIKSYLFDNLYNRDNSSLDRICSFNELKNILCSKNFK